MENTKRIVVLLILSFLTVGPAQSAEKPARRISNTRTASCLVKIACDPALLSLDFQSIDALLHSSSIAGRAAREVLDISPDRVYDLIEFKSVQHLDSAKLPQMPSSRGTPTWESALGEYDAMMTEDDTGQPEPPGTNSAQSKPSYSYSRGSLSSAAHSRTRGSDSRVFRTTPATSQSLANEKTILIHLAVHLDEDMTPQAEEFIDALILYLRLSFFDAFESHRERLTVQLGLADEEAVLAEEDLREKQDALRNISGSRVLDREVILGDIMELRDEIQRIEMDQTSDRVIIDATVKRIAEIEAKAKEQLENDAIAKELQVLLELRGKHLQNTKRTSSAEFADAEEKLARARIELAQRREQLSKSAGGNMIDSLNKRLTDSSIEMAQNEVHRATYMQQFDEAEKLLGRADDYELLSLKADIARQSLWEALVWRDSVSRYARMLRAPMVSVIGTE